MTPAERKQKIAAYAKGPALLAKAIRKFPKKMWKWKPAPNRWSIHEILVHMGDSETNAFVRARRFLAEPGAPVMAYDQDVWANKLSYHTQSTEDAVKLIALVRKMTHALVKKAPESAWSTVCAHPEHPNYTFDRWLEIYAKHVPGHITQMEKNYAEWKAR